MQFTIKSQVTTVLNNLQADKAKYGKAKDDILKNIYLSDEGKKVSLAEADAAWTVALQSAAGALNTIYQNAIDNIKGARLSGSDFQNSLTQALSFINLMDGSITDRIAFDLAQPLLGDAQAMNRFYVVLLDRLTQPSVTLDTLAGFSSSVDMLKRLQDETAGTFSRPWGNGKMGLLFGDPFGGEDPMGGPENVNSFNLAMELVTAYINNQVDAYEAHMSELQQTFSATPEQVDKLFDGKPVLPAGLAQ
ncbi:MAG: hypothetical protein FWC60_09795 [Firmicutes bacterium]|nr:hypothetical protein [Bacillota bacterium]